MRRPVYCNIVIILIVACLGAAVSHAQSIITGAVSGTITDPSGAILPQRGGDSNEYRYRRHSERQQRTLLASIYFRF